MITNECIRVISEYLRTEALAGKLPLDFTVGEFGAKTGIVELGVVFTPDQAEQIEQTLLQHPDVVPDCTIWLDEYIDICGGEYTEGAERCLLFDVSNPGMYVLTADEIARHRDNFIIKIEDKWRDGPKNVFLPLRFGYFDAIKNGSKTIECREYKVSWVKRLLGPKIETVTFQRGYAPGAEKLVVEVTGIELEDEDGKTRYSPDAIPDMAMPALILIHLGRRMCDVAHGTR